MRFVTTILALLLTVSTTLAQSKGGSYHFDGSISEKVLHNYLNRAVTGSELLVDPPFVSDGGYPHKELDIDIINEIGAKFIGRAIFVWGREDRLNNPLFLSNAEKRIEKIHKADPDVIFQACIFEAIYKKTVDKVKIPAWVFEAHGRPVEKRCFRYDDMICLDGSYVNRWAEQASVPDVTRDETKLWFTFLMYSYINIGVEAFHLGQIALIGTHDKNWNHFNELVTMVREYAKKHARRKYVLIDAHTPRGGMLRNGVSLLDFNSMPMRPKETPDVYMGAELEIGFEGALYQKSLGCVTPSGWKCESLPHLAEFDNFGVSNETGVVNSGIFIWGYDEITWLYMLEPEQRNNFLRYAQRWIRSTDPNGYMQIPLARVATPSKTEPKFIARAVAKSDKVPTGMGIVEVVKEIWADYPAK